MADQTDNQVLEPDNSGSSSGSSPENTTVVEETPNVKGEYDKDAEEISKNANEQLKIID